MDNHHSLNIPFEPLDEIATHISRIQEKMKHSAIDALLVASNANILYTSLRFFRGYVFIPRTGSPLWFVIRPLGFSPSEQLIYIRKPEQISEILSSRSIKVPQVLGLEFDSLSYSDVSRLSRAFSDSKIENASEILRNARSVKTPYEIDQMRQDAIHQMECYRRVPHCWKEDMTDIQLQVEIERVLRLEGALGFTRVNGALMDINSGSVIAGDNADVPTPYDFAMGGAGTSPALPVGADGTTIAPGHTVMVDMTGAFNVYQSDMTRTWRVGDVSDLALKAHECSREILRELEQLARPGVEAHILYHRAEEIVNRQNLAEYFMGHKQKAAFIGHGVGIELNEKPVLTPRSHEVLEAGMTIAIEPKFVIPGVGAVGVENTYVVRDNGLENLTPAPEELAEI